MDIKEALTFRTQGEWEVSPNTPGRADLGIPSVEVLTNEGQRILRVRTGGDSKRIALIDCQTPHKRGHGHETDCKERDANAALVCYAINNIERFQRERNALRDALEECIAEVDRATMFDCDTWPFDAARAVLDAVRANASLAKVSPQCDTLRKALEQTLAALEEPHVDRAKTQGIVRRALDATEEENHGLVG